MVAAAAVGGVIAKAAAAGMEQVVVPETALVLLMKVPAAEHMARRRFLRCSWAGVVGVGKLVITWAGVV